VWRRPATGRQNTKTKAKFTLVAKRISAPSGLPPENSRTCSAACVGASSLGALRKQKAKLQIQAERRGNSSAVNRSQEL